MIVVGEEETMVVGDGLAIDVEMLIDVVGTA